ncbi:MAG TPA: tRNA (adenosine(37)-N6)-threonylcarbamoyltransferase complex dimerization subunit type 1 TsaB [Ornithinibacter sp.]|nr:tRNA (adenosine(37)-N6)-threonylcarbamoyltransferase complex dimerization subunit type 1 TsaB [Ornithinibacter sp.]
MLILALDTSTSAIGVAVLAPQQDPVVGVAVDARAHTEKLAPLVRDTLTAAGATPSDLTAIAVGTGPGPFTGLRVGLVTAVTMGLALGIPVHGVCSLDALAEQALAEASPDVAEVLVATDARRKEVYWARYTRGGDGVVARTEPAVDRPAEVPGAVRALPTVGRGPLLYPDLFPNPLGQLLDVDPGWLGRLALRRSSLGAPMPVEPLYLRRPDALTTAERGVS